MLHANAFTVEAFTQVRVMVVTSPDRLVTLEPKRDIARRFHVRLEIGVGKRHAEEALHVFISNFGHTAQKLPKGTVIALAT